MTKTSNIGGPRVQSPRTPGTEPAAKQPEATTAAEPGLLHPEDGARPATNLTSMPSRPGEVVASEGPSTSPLGSRFADVPVQRGPNAPVAPEVKALMETYGIEKRLGRSAERFLKWGAVVSEKLNVSRDPSAVVDAAMDKDVRRQVFLVEGLFKMYRKEMPELVPQYEAIKAFEDSLGAYSYARGMVKLAEEKGLDPKIKAHLAHESAAAREALTKVVADGWIPDEQGRVPAIADMVEALAKADFGTYEEDRQFLRAELEDIVKDLDRDMKLDADEGGYDLTQLQGPIGLHEFRRDIRWFSVCAEAVDGLVQLTTERNPVKEYKNLIITDENDPKFVSDLSTSKFVKLPTAERENGAFEIPLSLYTANMKGVLDFGGAKDGGEEIEGIAHALQAIGEADDLASAMAKATEMLGYPATYFDDALKKGQEMFEEMKDNKLYKALKKEFDRYQED